MTTETSINKGDGISLNKAALLAGLGILIMVIVGPFAEFYAYGSLIAWNDPTATVQNITEHKTLFLIGIFSYLLMFSCDILVAWALFFFLKPVNKSISMLTGWLRLVYGVLSIIALTNVFRILKLINPEGYLATLGQQELNHQVMESIYAYSTGSNVAFLFFSTHLGLLGYLVFKSGFVPKVFGILLIISGAGYLVSFFLAPFLFPDFNSDILMVTFFGEIIFMIWLLVKGTRIKT
ncbi:MAG: DUF4386 domain-containing protein [Bacteroidetes bacterium]|nr:MAG: DUF4386 domain-containing protein [Bacteroidota bacterium]